jgi:hypothetical protein
VVARAGAYSPLTSAQLRLGRERRRCDRRYLTTGVINGVAAVASRCAKQEQPVQ